MIINANIVDGENSLQKVGDLASDLGFKKPSLIVDNNLFEGSDYISSFVDSNKSIFETRILFYDYHFEPSYQMLDEMMRDLNLKSFFDDTDVIIAIGGGSTMDTGKGLATLANNPGPSINYKGFPDNLIKPLPVIAIPSTTGTGSEVVFNASFIDEDSKVKMGINHVYNYPVLAILDPKIPSACPKKVLASSGCDALVHTLEAFMSRKSNDYVRNFSKIAYNLIMSNMTKLLKGKGDLSNWQKMQWSAVYAMFALSNSTAGPAGALSYYLGTNFGVNHGVAGGVFIGKVAKYNHDNGFFDLGDLYQNETHSYPNIQERSSLVLQQIEELLQLAEIPEKLSVFGVEDKDLSSFNEFARQAKESFSFNPVTIDLDNVDNLFINL